MDYLVRLAQCHQSFRQAEIQALATVNDLELEFVTYSDNVRLVFFFSWISRPLRFPDFVYLIWSIHGFSSQLVSLLRHPAEGPWR